MVYYYGEVTDEMLDSIEKNVKEVLLPYESQIHELEVEKCVSEGNDIGVITIKGRENSDDEHWFLLLKASVYHEYKQISIPNIFIPTALKYNGIGKKKYLQSTQ